MPYYLLWSPRLRRLFECEILNDWILIEFKQYAILYSTSTDRLYIRLRPLGIFMPVVDHPTHIDIEAIPSNEIFDALEELLKDSIVIYEEKEEFEKQ